MDIIRCVSTKHTSSCATRTPKYIVLHYTAGTSSAKGKARAVAQGFANSDREASADFIVDDAEIVQYNPDLAKRYTWAVGGTKYKTMSTSAGGRLYKVCTNKNSISIEMCSCKKNTKSLLASDTDWYIADGTWKNAVALTNYLMKEYNVPIENVIMHHEVTGKVCPNPFCVSELRLADWYKFKFDVEHYSSAPQASNSDNKTFKVKIIANELNVRNEPSVLGAKQTTVKKNEVYTIVDVSGNWGLLKAYSSNRNGWISLSDKYVTRL